MYTAAITAILELVPGIQEFRVSFPELASMCIKPGQHMMVTHAHVKGDDGEMIKRPFAIVSPPAMRDTLVFCVRISPASNPLVSHLATLRVGDTLFLDGPHGTHVLHDSDNDCIFVVGGTGLAGVLPMIRHLAMDGMKRKAILFYSIKTPEQYLYREELEHLAAKYVERFKVITTFTNISSNSVHYFTGRLSEDMIAKHVPFVNTKRAEIYICGSPAMIQDMNGILEKLGLGKNIINARK
ncbi:FAD-dependent oxidoreductase [Candidatus Woesearchaeota archaeon]|nr:FAD-dependent oxidoreductase [Candidatus Woesearchaeota archaeon]